MTRQTFDPDREDYISLTPTQWREIHDGDWLTFPPSEQPPLEVGDEIVFEVEGSLAFTPEEVARGVSGDLVVEVAAHWIEITEIRRTRKLLWRLIYKVHDMRPTWMRRGPPKPEGSRLRQRQWTALDEHGMTGELASALDPEAEVVDDGYRNVLEIGARLKRAEREERLQESFESQCKSFANAIRGIGRAAARDGVDAGVLLAPLLAEYERQIAKAREDEAA